MIPIKQLIRDGCWVKCTSRSRWIRQADECTFRMRVLSFEPLDYAEIDRPHMVTPLEEGAVRWLMKVEIVNLTKVNILFGHLKGEMRMVDSEGFEFQDDDAGLYFSKFAKRVGLSLGYLTPKIKAQGAAIFKMPDEDTDYSLTIKNGNIDEI